MSDIAKNVLRFLFPRKQLAVFEVLPLMFLFGCLANAIVLYYRLEKTLADRIKRRIEPARAFQHCLAREELDRS